MSKKSPKYMMLSGWLPVSYSHYSELECQWVGSNALSTDGFYGTLKMIADYLNDGINDRTIKKNVRKYLKDTHMAKFRTVALDYFIEATFTFVDEYYAINIYYKDAR